MTSERIIDYIFNEIEENSMNFSFDIINSNDMYIKLLGDYDDYKKNMLSARLAITCAETAWHLVEWVYKEYESKNMKQNQFKQDLKNKCPSFLVMQDITNGSKHCEITKYTPKVKNTEKHKGAFQATAFQNDTFDVSYLRIELDDGTIKKFGDEIKIVVDYWNKYFASISN